MANVIDYLSWRGDLLLSQDPFNEADSLVLCQLSYLDFAGIVPADFKSEPITISEAAGLYISSEDYKERSANIGPLISEETFLLLHRIGGIRRFSEMKLLGYVNHVDTQKEEQFSAITVLLPDHSIYVAFRGTDSTIIGWKEDFNMSFIKTVPSQTEALNYLKKASKCTEGFIRTGGHSKGGNLAVYASVFAPEQIQKRILDVYNNDGPGFMKETVDGARFTGLRARIHTIVPQSSFVGMLLEHDEGYEVVESTQKSIFQHDPFSWKVMGTGFVRLESVTNGSHFADMTLRQWLGSMNTKQKEEFVDGLFDVLGAANCETLNELSEDKMRKMILVAKSWKNFDERTKKMIIRTVKILLHMAKTNLSHQIGLPYQKL